MTIQKLQAELDESWEKNNERYLGTAEPQTIYQLRTLLTGMKKVENDQRDVIEQLQLQLRFYQEKQSENSPSVR